MKDDTVFFMNWLIAAFLFFSILCSALDVHAAVFPPLKIVQARGGLNVREQPSIASKAVYLLEDTETVILLESRDGWALVAKNTSPDMVLGWVCWDYLK